MVLICRVSPDERTLRLSESFDYDFNGEVTTEINDLPEIPKDFSIGLIVGPSGAGKTTLLRTLGKIQTPSWERSKSVFSHFSSYEDGIEKFGAVGFNSIPQMCLPYEKLSNGERFRCDLARVLGNGAIIDEFTSVVNRDVAKSASNALRRYADEKQLKKIVLASCHYDIIEWLRPDWVYNVLTGEIHSGRYLQRPKIQIDIHKTDWKLWRIFEKFHYLNSSINKAARCYAGFWGEQLVVFGAVLASPNGYFKNGWRAHRTVVLPDFQGMGIGTRFSDAIGQMYVDDGCKYFSRTANPRFGRYRENSSLWKPTTKNRRKRTDVKHKNVFKSHYADNKRICWSHEYIGNKK